MKIFLIFIIVFFTLGLLFFSKKLSKNVQSIIFAIDLIATLAIWSIK